LKVARKHANLSMMTDPEAYLLRENTGTTGLVQTARTAVFTLAGFDIPHLIVGGLAVQEHGYPRLTTDVDIVVPDVLDAMELLTANLSGPLVRVTGFENRVKDSRNGVVIDLLPAGRVLKRGCRVPFPQPFAVTEHLQIIGLEGLVSLKLDSWSNTPLKRLQDKTDVIQLITRRQLPRDLAVAAVVRTLYTEIWDALQAEA
jgi:hypothetical protein